MLIVKIVHFNREPPFKRNTALRQATAACEQVG
jgi:hypothetical protein